MPGPGRDQHGRRDTEEPLARQLVDLKSNSSDRYKTMKIYLELSCLAFSKVNVMLCKLGLNKTMRCELGVIFAPFLFSVTNNIVQNLPFLEI